MRLLAARNDDDRPRTHAPHTKFTAARGAVAAEFLATRKMLKFHFYFYFFHWEICISAACDFEIKVSAGRGLVNEMQIIDGIV